MSDTPTVSGSTETLCRRLQQLWDAGQRPDLGWLLAEAGSLDAAEMARVLASDQWRRWQAGERVPAEEYLKRFGQVAAVPEAALELIYAEIVLRKDLGEQPTVGEYLARFPYWAEGLRRRLPLPDDLDAQSAATFRLADLCPPSTLPPEGSLAAQPVPGLPNVPGYEMLELLGRGGMGVVYKARHLGLKRLVALKMILDQSGSRKQELARFRIEAEAVARLQHPNIVQIYEVGEWCPDRVSPPLPFLALEFVHGGTLAQRLAGELPEPQSAAELTEILARAMHTAHLRGIVHRDLKPANILLQEAGLRGQNSGMKHQAPAAHCFLDHESWTPKITDFGLAKFLDAESGQTRTGDVLGTPRYMAPEQARGWVREVGPATDVYALGAILYHAVTGKPPFEGATPLETVLQVVQHEPVPPRRLQPKLPRDLETICLKCLKKDPGQRYGSALELADDLRRFLRGEPIHARPVAAWERAAKWIRRRPALASAVIASFLVVIGSVAGFLIYLNSALDQARQEWQNQTERAQRAERRSEVQDLVLRAETAAHGQDWQGAALHAAQALRRITAEEEDSDLCQRAAAVRGQAEQQLEDRAHLTRFYEHRSDALSGLGLHVSGASPADWEKTRTAARAALAEFQVDPEIGDALALSATYSATEKAAIVADCYELLLLLADAEAPPRPGQQPEALREPTHRAVRILQRAARLGVLTQSYHRRLANYYKRLGDDAKARLAADQAIGVPLVGALDFFLSGLEHYQSGQFEPARADFGRALLAQPDHFWARYFQSLCQLRTHQAEAAVAGFTACLAQNHEFVWLYVLRALAQTERGDLVAAEEDFKAALARRPDADARYGIYVGRANLRVRQDRPDDAIADLRAAIPMKPDHYQAYLNLAQVYRQQKNWPAAAEQLGLAFKRAPQLSALYRARAQLAVDQGDTQAAQSYFRQAIQRETASAVARADDHVEIGRLLQQNHGYAEALQAYDAALQERPKHGDALRGRARMLLELKRYKEAIDSFNRSLEVGPASADLYQLRGLARSQIREYRAALDDYSQALQLEPTATRYVRRGWLYLLSDAFELARQDFDQAIGLDVANGDAHAGRGLALVQLGRTKDAITDAREAVRLGPQTPPFLCKVAGIYSQALARLDGTPGGRNADLRLDYQQEAVRLISRALDRLSPDERPLFWKQTIHPDKALGPLRQLSKEFRDLENAQAFKLPH